MFSHVSVDPPYNHQAPKIQLQSRRDQRSAPQIPSQPTQQIPRTCVSGLHRSPTNQPANPPTSRARPWRASQPAETSGWFTQTYTFYQLTQIPTSNDEGDRVWHRLATRRRRRSGAPRPSPPEGLRLRPRAWIPEESGQVGLDKSPQVRRQGNRIRRTNDGSRRPPARPGVMPAPGFAVPTSLPYHVFLEASR